MIARDWMSWSIKNSYDCGVGLKNSHGHCRSKFCGVDGTIWQVVKGTTECPSWLADRFGAFDLCYEVNDRYPPQRLSLAQLQGIGRVLADELGKWTNSPEGKQHHQNINERLVKHRENRIDYLKNKTEGGNRTPHELLTLGF